MEYVLSAYAVSASAEDLAESLSFDRRLRLDLDTEQENDLDFDRDKEVECI